MIRPPPSSTLFPSTPLFRSAVLVSALSFTDTAPFHVEIAGLFTSPVSVTPTVASAGSSEPYIFVWFGLVRSPEHTSELQPLINLVSRPLVEKQQVLLGSANV